MEIVGIPRECKTGEQRVGLTPEGIKKLTRKGIRVLVETRAGLLSGFTDGMYEKVGALIVSTAHRLWKGATLIKKVKEPQSSEYHFFQSKHILFTFLHLASQENCDLLRHMMRAGMTALAYETVEKNNEAVILKPMSEIAGTLAAYFAGILRHLVDVREGQIHYHSWYRKILEKAIRNYPEPLHGSDPGHVLILGGGHVGQRAAKMVCLMGGKVTLTESRREKRELLVKEFMEKKMWVDVVSSESDWQGHLEGADVIIGAVHLHGQRAPIIITREMLQTASRNKRKIIIDVSVDQGGNVYESRSTTFENPLYVDSFGNIRLGVTNMPSLVRGKASMELEKVTLDYTLALAEDMQSAVKRYPELEKGINVYKGKLKNEAIAGAHKIGILGGGNE